MYCEYFKLRDYPFLSTIDRRFYYLSEAQSQAKSYMNYLLEIRDGMVVLTGVSGIGKSTLIDQLLSEMHTDVSVAHIQHTLLDEQEFLLALCMQFNCVPEARDRPSLYSALQDYAMDQHLLMRPLLIVIDDAQNLSPRVFEELRLLASMDMFGRKLIQIILCGQPELERILSELNTDALAQLIRLKHRLEPLSRREISEYIDYRLYIAGNDGNIIFPHELLDEILSYTGGVPRLINQLCDMMLVLTFINRSRHLDRKCLRNSVGKLGWPLYVERKHEAGYKLSGDNVTTRPLPLLVIKKGDLIVGKYLLNKKRMLIGRDPNLDICIETHGARRVHAQLVYLDNQFFIHDLNQSDETYLQGKPVKWHALSDQDVVRIGEYTLEYQLRDGQNGEINAPELATEFA